MNAEVLIGLLEEHGLVSARIARQLRQQVRSADKRVSARALAKALVQKGLLTQDQARRMLRQMSAASAAPSPPPTTRSAPPPAGRSAGSSDLGLAPLDDELTRVDDDEIVEPVEPPTYSVPPAMDIDDKLAAAAEAADAAEVELTEADQVASVLDIPDLAQPAGVTAPVVRRGSVWTRWLHALRRRAPKAPTIRANPWDSPLILVGGGTLILMIIIGGVLFVYLTRGTGDEAFKLAEEDYRAEAYGQAISKYRQFLDDFPNHPRASSARVRIALAQIRNIVASNPNWERALEVARDVLPPVEAEPALEEVRPELATLLPDIMAGLTSEAEKASDVRSADHYVRLADQALEQCNNSNYLPTSLRSGQQSRIEENQARLAVVQRRVDEDRQLNQAAEAIQEAAGKGNIRSAYAIRANLLKQYPALESHTKLLDAMLVVAERERELIRAVTDPSTPLYDDRAQAAAAAVVLADRSGETAEGLSGQVIAVLVQGAVFALDAETGNVLWRRFIGMESVHAPVPLPLPDGTDFLVIDGQHSELVRLDGTSGKLVWRLACPHRRATPVVAQSDTGPPLVFLTCGDAAEGQIYRIDPESGTVLAAAALPNGISAAAGIDTHQRRILQPAMHSTLYVLNHDTLTAEEVVYLGHSAAAISVPPVSVDTTILVAENAGPGFSLLHAIVPQNTEDTISRLRPVQTVRLEGQVVVPMHVFGRRVLVATDRGVVQIFDVDGNKPAQPLRPTAAAVSSVSQPMPSYPVLVEPQVWIADVQLARYEFQPSRSALVRKWIHYRGDRFVGPLEKRGAYLFGVRRPRDQAGFVCTAFHAESSADAPKDGQIVWETRLAVPPADTPAYDPVRQQLRITTANGDLFLLDSRSLPSAGAAQPNQRTRVTRLKGSVPLPGGRAVFAGDPPSNQIAVWDPEKQPEWRGVTLDTGGDVPAQTLGVIPSGLIVPCSGGSICLVSPTDGKALAIPFLPRLEPGRPMHWSQPTISSEHDQFVLADTRGGLFRIALQREPVPHLTAVHHAVVPVPLGQQLVWCGNTIFATSVQSGVTKLVALAADALQITHQWTLDGRVSFGPEQIGSRVLIATTAGQLWCLNGESKVLWQVIWKHGPLAGSPRLANNRLWLAEQRGIVTQMDPDTGQLLTNIDMGQPLGTGPVPIESRAIVVTLDATLLLVDVADRSAVTSGASPLTAGAGRECGGRWGSGCLSRSSGSFNRDPTASVKSFNRDPTASVKSFNRDPTASGGWRPQSAPTPRTPDAGPVRMGAKRSPPELAGAMVDAALWLHGQLLWVAVKRGCGGFGGWSPRLKDVTSRTGLNPALQKTACSP